MKRKTHTEKKLVLTVFFTFCNEQGIIDLEEITKAKAYSFLAALNDKKGGSVANKYRKHLMAAWSWGLDFVEDFPQFVAPFSKVKPFAEEPQDRYVPPEEDVIKVLQQAKGQDLIMLLTLYFTGARRSEVFRLQWQDIDFTAGRLRLMDSKGGGTKNRVRWLEMHPELVKALLWWHAARPCKVDNVFMQEHCTSAMGEAFSQRRNFMARLCERAGVKPSGFHAIRHKSAAITFVEKGLNAAQVLMGHYRATTTDIYTRSAGLYTNQGAILEALGGSGIGQVVGNLLKNNLAHELVLRERDKNCNPEYVTQ